MLGHLFSLMRFIVPRSLLLKPPWPGWELRLL